MERKLTKEVNINGLMMGGNNPVIIQSMCNTDTRDVDATVKAIESAGDKAWVAGVCEAGEKGVTLC